MELYVLSAESGETEDQLPKRILSTDVKARVSQLVRRSVLLVMSDALIV